MSFNYRNDDWSEDESDVEFNSMHKHKEHLLSEIIHQCNFGSRHLINACLASKASLQYQADIPAIAPTNIVHGQNKKIGETNAGETPTCNKQMLKKRQHALSIIFS